jgi:hypothetical protein
MMHSSTCSFALGTSSNTARIAYEPSTGEGTRLNPPMNFPIGVRLAARITGVLCGDEVAGMAIGLFWVG